MSNLLRLIGEWRWWSRGGVLSECWGARSVREVCEPRLAGESLAPYKTKTKQILLPVSKYKQNSVDLCNSEQSSVETKSFQL